MPIYEYECTCCSSRFELKRSFSESTPVSCPRCGGNARRIFSPVPIIFKGPGFYSTDSNKNYNRSSHEGSTDENKAGNTEKGSTGENKAGNTEKGSTGETKADSTEKDS